MLELFATRGLNKSAVHVTRMAVGEGLIGTIAENVETLNLAEAKAHPDFKYRPETGEEKFHSFAGVPIVYRERRSEEHTTALQSLMRITYAVLCLKKKTQE